MDIVLKVILYYEYLIIAYVLMSWFPLSGVFLDIYKALASICEPYLGIFRRFIPPMGGLDVSAIAAILVLQVIMGALRRIL
jgi:uncharacterized protein YggT (Ycf19 family)